MIEATKGATDAQLEALHAETPEDEVKYREAKAKGGRSVMKDGQPLMLAYVTARYIADSLDGAVGPALWQDAYERLADGSVRCGIGILIDGQWVWKYDVGVPSTIEPAKGAFSDAFKRAAVKWGIARDLYEERDEDNQADAPVEEEQRQPIQRRLGRTAPARGGAQRGAQRPARAQQPAPEVSEEDSEWFCPVHDDFKVIPPGISKRTGKEYGAFYACPTPGCDERGPFLDD